MTAAASFPAGNPPTGNPSAGGCSAAEGDIVDAHVHLWDTGRFRYPWLDDVPVLRRPFLPADLLDDAGSAGAAPPAAVVVVEADRTAAEAPAEARWVLASSSPALPVVGVVAHVPLDAGPAGAAALERMCRVGGVVGVRRLLQDEPPGVLSGAALAAGLGLLAHGLPFDLCLRSHQLTEAVGLVRRLPEVRFVLDHLGKPEVRTDAFAPWAADLRRLAALPNVVCKLSGLVTEADPDHRDAGHLLPFLRHALDAFGPSRCLFGSDWPVLSTAWPYPRWVDVVREAVDDLSAGERDLVLRRNALETYAPPGPGGAGRSQ